MPGFLSRTKRKTIILPKNMREIKKKKKYQETLKRLRERIKTSKSEWMRSGEWDLGAPSAKIHPENKFRDKFRDLNEMSLEEILAEIAQLEKELGVKSKEELGAESKEESGHGKKRRTIKHNKRKTKRKTKRGHRGKSPKKKRTKSKRQTKGGRRSRRRRR